MKRLLPALLLAVLATGCEYEPDSTSLVATRSPSGSPPPVVRLVPPARPSATPSRARATTPPAPRPTATRAATRPPAPRTTAPRTAAPRPVAPKPVTASTCGAPANPWGFNHCGRGSYISSPPASFCQVFDCIDSFWESTNGYVMRCDDGMYSHSGGRRGSCSWHGGNDTPLYR